MAGWQEELAILLRELGVTQEEPETHLPTTRLTTHRLLRSDVKRRRRSTDALFWDGTENGAGDSAEEGEGHGDSDDDIGLADLTSMRREVDSIVRQVIRLMQHGDLDESTKEDVMVVLRVLRRGASAASEQSPESDEVYLEHAAAMLHFCRLVLNLSEAAIEDL